MRELRVYELLSRLPGLGYRGKILLITFLGIHLPLLTLIVTFLFWLGFWSPEAPIILGSALVATLLGTLVTLFIIDRLLQPILLTTRALHRFALHREAPVLPTSHRDVAGRLMAETVASLKRLERALDDLAHHDPETGLPNREQLERRLDERLQSVRTSGGAFAVCGLRLANLEALSGSFDRPQTTALVRCVAQRLEAVLPPGSQLARLEPATFAFCLGDAADPDAMTMRLDRVAEAVGADIVDGPVRVVPEIALGATLAPADAAQPASLLDNLHHALNDARSGRRPRTHFFSPATRAAMRERFLLEQELSRAVAARELLLHFQPILDTRAGRIAAVEALVRWQHPERGLLAPGLFIPIAERRPSLMEAMGLWVLRAACREAGSWEEPALEAAAVTVNLSAHQLQNRGLVAEIAHALALSGLPAHRLELELTETAAMVDERRTLTLFGELRELGVRLVIDDFGTGHSNLRYLRELPFDKLKIDRTFVADIATRPTSHAICRALIGLAHGLGIDVVGEGVETEEELRTLEGEGCRLFQGFHIARPLPPAALRRDAAGLRAAAGRMWRA